MLETTKGSNAQKPSDNCEKTSEKSDFNINPNKDTNTSIKKNRVFQTIKKKNQPQKYQNI